MAGRRKTTWPWRLLLSLALFGAMLALCVSGVRDTRGAQQAEAVRVLTDSLRRAAVSCYALEGAYPDTLAYLTENYGVSVDTERYFVDYQIFASNIMPDIVVLPRSGGE